MDTAIVTASGWIVQAISPIDFGWQYLPKAWDVYSLMKHDPEREEDATYFFNKAQQAISAISSHHYYDGAPPVSIFSVSASFMPEDNCGEFEPVFFHKIANNGTTFVASQFGVPWLDFE